MNQSTPMRLVWLTVNCSYSHSSLALPLLHAAAADPRWQWERKECIREEDSAAIAAEITRLPCDLVCATLYLFNREKVFDILKRVHALSPETHIAVGGPECAAGSASVMLEQNTFLSTVFSGEGEVFFPDFLKHFSKNRKIRQVIPKDKNAVYEEWIHSPFPAADPFFRTDRPFVQLETSRGCPMNCAYCTSSGITTRYKDLSRVEEELELLHAKGIHEVRVLDRTFNLPQKRGTALLRLFARYPEIRFHMEIHPQFMGEELRECFRNARPGQLHVEAGIQSLNPEVQKAIGRRSEVEDALDGLRFLVLCNAFETHTDLLAGLPGQTLESLRSDLVTLLAIAPAEIQLEILKILPGTPILRLLKQYGIIYSPMPPYDVMRTDAMSTAEILFAAELSRLLDLFFNHRFMHPVMKKATVQKPEIFLAFADEIHEKNTDLNAFLDLKKRFRFFNAFLKQHNCTEAQQELAKQWLLAGYPPLEDPEKLTENIRHIPEKAVIKEGNPESRILRESRFYSLQYGNRILYFVYNRAFVMNRPCAVYEL